MIGSNSKSRSLVILIACTILFAYPAEAEDSPSGVALIHSASRAFEVQSGQYQVRYDLDRDPEGWIEILRKDRPDAAIVTRLANGQHLDVSASGAGERDIYQWKLDRKDSRIFQSLQLSETDEGIEVILRSQRRWACFESRLIAYKGHPGLLHWVVVAEALQDKALSGEATPNCAFSIEGKRHNPYDPVTHSVVRYREQRGPATGITYFRDLPMESYVFYLEDLTSLNDLYRLTGCDNPYDYPPVGNPGSVRMGIPEPWFQLASPDGNDIQPLKPFANKVEEYSEFGYRRPPNVFIPRGKRIVLDDTYLYLRPAVDTSNTAVCHNFADMLSTVYQFIQKPALETTDYSNRIVPAMVKDILRPENNALISDQYMIPRAYVRYEHDDAQLWTVLNLLQPLDLYLHKFPDHVEAKDLYARLNECLPLYYDSELKFFHNNMAPLHPDQFFTIVYIVNPAMMMADLALQGNENAKRIYLDCRETFLKMGRALDYVFADVWLRDFTKQKGFYQSDGTGSYIYMMMAYYQLSDGKDKEALQAAQAAAGRMAERCMDFTWEVNQSMSGAVGCAELYRITNDRIYLDISYIGLANALQEAWLWECDYGIGEYVTTFWSFCPCPGAPSSAEYEAWRMHWHIRQYIDLVGEDISPTLRAMLEDGLRYGPVQSLSAFPPILIERGARHILAREGTSETNCGEIRYDQMIPLEDVRCGWGTDLEWWQNNTKNGVVGQEIYGAGGPIWYAVWEVDRDE